MRILSVCLVYVEGEKGREEEEKEERVCGVRLFISFYIASLTNTHTHTHTFFVGLAPKWRACHPSEQRKL